MKKNQMLLSLLMLFVFLLGLSAAADSAAPQYYSAPPRAGVEPLAGGVSSSEAAEGYLLRTFGIRQDDGPRRRASRALAGNDQVLYSYLANMIPQVADGTRSSTVVQVPMSEFNVKISYTLKELECENDPNAAANVFFAKVKEDLDLHCSLINSQLRADFPFDMYWADNQYWTGGDLPNVHFDGTSFYYEEGDCFSYSVIVSPFYSVGGASLSSDFDTSFAAAAKSAAANARAIVDRCANASSDYAMLQSYKNAICDLVDYNDEAAHTSNPTNSNPWQVVWVFDGDPSTNVVCEGYSKAFQYLCDMSTFRGNTSCDIATGIMQDSTGGGEHMWNLVTLDGKTYLADVTNCDGVPGNPENSSIGYPDHLFLVGSDTPYAGEDENETGYVFTVGSTRIYYIYDQDTTDIHHPTDLQVSADSYQKSACIAASAQEIILGDSITLTVSVPGQDEFLIWYEQGDGGHWMNADGLAPEMVCTFTPTAAGKYVFYAAYYDPELEAENDEGNSVITDARVQVTVLPEAPGAVTVTGTMSIGTDVTFWISDQEDWDNLYLEVEYLPENGDPEIIAWTDQVSESFSIIGVNFQRTGDYCARLFRLTELSEGGLDYDHPIELGSADFSMNTNVLHQTYGTFSQEELILGEELIFTGQSAEELAYQVWIADPTTGEVLSGTGVPLNPSAQGNTVSITYDAETPGQLEGQIWAKMNGIWQYPLSFQIPVISQVQLPSEELNMYYGADSLDISRELGQIALGNIIHLTGEPAWTVTQSAGTAEVELISPAAVTAASPALSVKTFPAAPETAEYTVRCVWGPTSWEKTYTVHYLDLSADHPTAIQLNADGVFWMIPTGETLDPQGCFSFNGLWRPSGGETVQVQVEADDAVLAQLTRNPDTGIITLGDPGAYSLNVTLAFANVSKMQPFTLYVTREDGTVPAGCYASEPGPTLSLPNGIRTIEAEAFSGSSAEIVMIPEGCESIGDYAFANMSRLREITIPASVHTFGEGIFDGSGCFAVYAGSPEAAQAALQYTGLLVLTEE